MKRGVIVAIDERFLTLLTNEGEFYLSHKFEAIYEIGQEIEFEPVKKNPRVKYVKKPKYVKMIMLAAVFVLSFLGMSFWPNQSEQMISAYMTIDINPSIELAVNEQFEVVQLKGYNADGKKIVEEISGWENKQFDIIFSDILAIIKSQGYMKKGKELTFATVIMSDQYFEESLRKHTDFVTKKVNEEEVSLNLIEGSKTERQLAQEKGLTLGAYKESNESTEYDNAPKSDIDESEEQKMSEVTKEESDEQEDKKEMEKHTSIEEKEIKQASDDKEATNASKVANESKIINHEEEEIEEKVYRKRYTDEEHKGPPSKKNKDMDDLNLKEKHQNKHDKKDYHKKDDDKKNDNDKDNNRGRDDDEWHDRHHPGKRNDEVRDENNERKKYNDESP
ncbi:anti-sigma factor domain-containing protein [Cytobacillus sp. FSL K6-0265]|uniref:anti-sigma factor domain-containing protein n=1 Tax=Cytobacillus sp. FSL K6-0265 TaxID=2921448 RepID=UPI0030FC1094